MKYLLLLLSSLGLKSELDLTIPKQDAVYVPPKKFIINLRDYNEPPTRNQIIFFWTINALDVYITHEGIRKCSICVEKNPFLPERPKLKELILQKTIVAGFISQNTSKKGMTFINTGLAAVVINNYNITKKY